MNKLKTKVFACTFVNGKLVSSKVEKRTVYTRKDGTAYVITGGNKIGCVLTEPPSTGCMYAYHRHYRAVPFYTGSDLLASLNQRLPVDTTRNVL